MIPSVADRTDDLKRLCRHYNVQRLDLFGSAAKGGHHPEDSDLDFLVEFQPAAFSAYADAYFGLLEALEQLSESLWTSSSVRRSKSLLPAIRKGDEGTHL